MDRKEALHRMAGGLLLAGSPMIASGEAVSTAAVSTAAVSTAAVSTGAFLKDFLHRWGNALGYSLKVLDKMPADLYGYQPTPELMSFGKQYTHAGYWNTYFIGNLVGQPPLPEPADAEKAEVIRYYTSCHNHCTDILEKLDESQLDKTGYGNHEYWQKHTGRDYLLRAFMHVAHHRAETLIYLRLNGIEPPFFEF